MNPIDPTTPIVLTLEAQEVNLLIAIIAETTGFPLRLTSPLHAKITTQAQAAADQSPSALPSPLMNGAAAHATD